MTKQDGVLLFVDDEPSLLLVLKRLFQRQGYQVITAESGQDGIAILSQNQVDIVVSDLQMPHMDGVTFLKIAAQRWPYTKRILLTGFSDFNLAVSAINEGQIDYYLSKPWNEEFLIGLIANFYENKKLADKNSQLQELISKQNEELKLLNGSLEEKVKQRTMELDNSYAKLKATHNAAIQVFLSMQELHEGENRGYCRSVATHAKLLAKAAQLSDAGVPKVYLAAMLHNLGKSGLPTTLIRKPYMQLNTKEHEEFMQYPIIGATILSAFPSLKVVANTILYHCERYNGKGYPYKLAGEEIPIEARILHLAVTYNALMYGLMNEKKNSSAEALQFIREHKDYFDPALVPLFFDMIAALANENSVVAETTLETYALKPGMILSRDVKAENGLVLLAKDYVLTENTIDKIKVIRNMPVYIYSPAIEGLH